MTTMKGKRAAIYKRRIAANIAKLPDGSSSRVRIPIVWTSNLVNVRTVSRSVFTTASSGSESDLPPV
jgi:hypothetical protein